MQNIRYKILLVTSDTQKIEVDLISFENVQLINH